MNGKTMGEFEDMVEEHRHKFEDEFQENMKDDANTSIQNLP